MPLLAAPDAATAGPISRRDLLGLGTGAAALLALGGCGTDDTAPAGATRTVEGASGPVEIPVSPQRVVSTDYYTTYALLDVGFTVVATAQATVGGVLPSLQAAYDAIPKIGTPSALSLEAIVAQRPDLILGTQVPNLPADLQERLSAVARPCCSPRAARPAPGRSGRSAPATRSAGPGRPRHCGPATSSMSARSVRGTDPCSTGSGSGSCAAGRTGARGWTSPDRGAAWCSARSAPGCPPSPTGSRAPGRGSRWKRSACSATARCCCTWPTPAAGSTRTPVG